MPRTDLAVPYEEKDEAKSLGARWDPSNRVWFVPEGIDLAAFGKWLPTPAQCTANLESADYYLAQNTTDCHSCGENTRVVGLLLPPGAIEHAIDEENGEPFDDDFSDPTFIFYIEHLSDAVQQRIRELAPRYRRDYSRTAQRTYWMNHCEHCGAKVGDHELYCEPDGAFNVEVEEQAIEIELMPIPEPLAARSTDFLPAPVIILFDRLG